MNFAPHCKTGAHTCLGSDFRTVDEEPGFQEDKGSQPRTHFQALVLNKVRKKIEKDKERYKVESSKINDLWENKLGLFLSSFDL